jgi:hypothetical protein
MKKLRDNSERARLAVVMLYVMAGLDFLSAISSFLQYRLLVNLKNGDFISQDAIQMNDGRESILAFVYLLVFIATAVIFIKWFRRAYYNLHLRSSRLRHSEGWAAGAWFVPIFNLYAPVQIMTDLYEESRTVLKKAGFTEKFDLPMNLVGFWWAMWILSNIVTNVSVRFLDAENIGSLIGATLGSMVGHLLSLGAAILLVQVIQKYAKVEPLLNNMQSEIDSIGQEVSDEM